MTSFCSGLRQLLALPGAEWHHIWVFLDCTHIAFSGAFSIGFLYFFFADCNLLSLRNTPTKFRMAVLRDCRDMWEVVENGIIAISGACFNRFLYFILLIVIYIGYEILLQSFARLCYVVVEICEKWLKMALLPYLVCFSTDFFTFFCWL
jgi:hypothetical protein